MITKNKMLKTLNTRSQGLGFFFSLFFLTSYFLFLAARPVAAAPSYATSFSVDKAQAARGETVVQTFTVTNNGDAPLTNIFVYLFDRPAAATYVSGSSQRIRDGVSLNVTDAWYNDPSGTNLGTLNVGQSFAFRWSVTVNNDAPLASILTTRLSTYNSQLTNHSGHLVSFTVAQSAARNSLCATKAVDKQTANVGDSLTFTLTVCNDGDVDQTNVLVYDRLPRELDYVAGSTKLTARGASLAVGDGWVGSVNSGQDGQGLNLGTINSGETFTVTFQAKLNSLAVNDQKVENVAQVKSDQLAFQKCAAAFTAKVPSVGSARVCVDKKIRLLNGSEVDSVAASTHVFVPGEEVTYRIFVSNSGSVDAKKVSANDLLPPYLYWLRGDGGYALNENKVNFDFEMLKAGESRTLTYIAKVRDEIPSGPVTQENDVKIYEDGLERCRDKASLVIGKPGAILAAAVLPETGAFPPSVLWTFSLVAAGVFLRIRKIKIRHSRYW